MYEVTSTYGFPIWVCLTPDADFERYGYFYQIYKDENGDCLIDWGNTYDQDYDSSFEWVCTIAERLEF